MRERFAISNRLEHYDDDLLSQIVERSSGILKLKIDKKSCFEIARRSRGTPRISNSLLRRVRDFAQIKSDGKIDLEITKFALSSLNVDKNGLDEMDNKILETIVDKYNGGPVGLSTIATSLSENSETIEEVYEPFLIQLLVGRYFWRQIRATASASPFIWVCGEAAFYPRGATPGWTRNAPRPY